MDGSEWKAACFPYASQATISLKSVWGNFWVRWEAILGSGEGRGVMKLTIKSADGLKLPKGKKDYIEFDDDIPGLGLRLRESGSRTWIFQYRIGSKQRRMVLGSANSAQLNLAEVRKTASRLHGRVQIGQDPAIDKETAKRDADNTFGALVDQYLEARKSEWRERSRIEIERHLTKQAKSLHSMPIAGVSQRAVATLFNRACEKRRRCNQQSRACQSVRVLRLGYPRGHSSARGKRRGLYEQARGKIA